MSDLTEDRATLHGGELESCAITGVASAVTKPEPNPIAGLEAKLTAVVSCMDAPGVARGNLI